MKRLKDTVSNSLKGISLAGFRFPLTIVSLLAAATFMIRLIATGGSQEAMLQKYIFTLFVGAVLGVAAQFAVERLEPLSNKRLIVYVVAVLLMAGYFLILLPIPELNARILVRSFVTIFALMCLVLWIPSYQSKVDFNLVALVHVKAFSTSFVYSGVLAIGIAAIIAAIDILLFGVNYKAYLYMLTIIWVVFAPIYYLSLLPMFHSKDEGEQRRTERFRSYPKFLEILISNIAIPLISAYTVVLIAYFLKILFTRTWPSGQVGPLVLIYTIAGLIIFILASLLNNKFVLFYRKLFPKILIVIVIMQLISVWIRIRAYGITESRYYILLFGIYSILAGILLCLNKEHRNGWLALLAAILAILSIIPPIDAFTVSRNSQIRRLEALLEEEGMLKNENITKNDNADAKTKIEVTNILYYLEQNHYLSYLDWLPEDFEVYPGMQRLFGFGPTYTGSEEVSQYVSIFLDMQQALPIEGYDVMLYTSVGRYIKGEGLQDSAFMIDGKEYRLDIIKSSGEDVRVSIKDTDGTEVIGTGLMPFVKEMTGSATTGKESLSPEELSFEVNQNGYQLKIIFQSINYVDRIDQEDDYEYSMYVLVATP